MTNKSWQYQHFICICLSARENTFILYKKYEELSFHKENKTEKTLRIWLRFKEENSCTGTRGGSKQHAGNQWEAGCFMQIKRSLVLLAGWTSYASIIPAVQKAESARGRCYYICPRASQSARPLVAPVCTAASCEHVPVLNSQAAGFRKQASRLRLLLLNYELVCFFLGRTVFKLVGVKLTFVVGSLQNDWQNAIMF